MSRPDFGRHKDEFHGTIMECSFVAPGLTLHDLTMIFQRAKNEAAPGDELRGDPSKWPDVRGVYAVTEAILNAIYGTST